MTTGDPSCPFHGMLPCRCHELFPDEVRSAEDKLRKRSAFGPVRQTGLTSFERELLVDDLIEGGLIASKDRDLWLQGSEEVESARQLLELITRKGPPR